VNCGWGWHKAGFLCLATFVYITPGESDNAIDIESKTYVSKGN